MQKVSIFWFRRDLRLEDNHGLHQALKSAFPVLPIFIFDQNILDKLSNKCDPRVDFIHQALGKIQSQLRELGSGLTVLHGTPAQAWEELLSKYEVAEVYTNHDYEPYARQRDRYVFDWLRSIGIPLFTFKDQCMFEYKEVLKEDKSPYTIFTPYSRKWLQRLESSGIPHYDIKSLLHRFYKYDAQPIPDLTQLGFGPSHCTFPSARIPIEIIEKYATQRDVPGIVGTTRLSLHLRFGTVSIRQCVQAATKHSQKWLMELVWRDFYMMILWHFPHVATEAFKPAYNAIPWRNNEQEFQAWKSGNTGIPIVDAGMRELNHTGFMHNRVRMIVASFLTKQLLIDWRWGEAYFAEKLLDFDLSANNGGWQWSAGSGCDAAPYFRVFNPILQTEKFDPEHTYIKKWVPEYQDTNIYPRPMVDLAMARERCLQAYASVLK